MRSSVRAWLQALRESYWFLATLMTLFALALAVATLAIDRAGGGAFLQGLGLWDPGIEGARQQLSSVTSAMITVAATVFAITIAAVSFASGNFGPRVLANFMNDRGNQLSLGVFISTFVYNLMILRAVRGPEEDGAFLPHLSVFVALLTVLIAVGTLVFFLHHVPTSIRVNTLLGGIGRRLLADIEQRFPDSESRREPEQHAPGEPVAPDKAGYIEIIDFRELDEIARRCGVTIRLTVRTGDFVHGAVPIAEICGGSLGEDGLLRFRKAFSIDDQRSYVQDLEFLFDELVEIALRALSPGINDPYTAITSLHWMGAAMASLAGRDLSRGPEQDNYDPARVRPVPDDFGHYLRRSFGSARPSVAESTIAAKVFLDTLVGVARAASSEERRRAVLEEGRRFIEQVEAELEGPSLAEMRERFDRFRAEARQ